MGMDNKKLRYRSETVRCLAWRGFSAIHERPVRLSTWNDYDNDVSQFRNSLKAAL